MRYFGLGRQPERRQNFLTVGEGGVLHGDEGWEKFHGSDGNGDGCRRMGLPQTGTGSVHCWPYGTG